MKKILLLGLLSTSAMAQQPYDNCQIGYTLQQIDYRLFECVPMQTYYRPTYAPQVYVNPIVEFGRFFGREHHEQYEERHEHHHRDRD